MTWSKTGRSCGVSERIVGSPLESDKRLAWNSRDRWLKTVL